MFNHNQVFFPKDPITGDNILITRLKPTPDGAGEQIHIEGKCSIGTGKEHIRFSPVSKIVFINKIDPEIYSEELAQQYPKRDWILSRILWLCGQELAHWPVSSRRGWT